METIKQYGERIERMNHEEREAHRRHLASRSIARAMWEDYWSDPVYTAVILLLALATGVAMYWAS